MASERRVVSSGSAVAERIAESAGASCGEADVQAIASRASELAFELGRASTRPLETVVAFWTQFFSAYVTQARQQGPAEQLHTDSVSARADELRQWTGQFDAKLADLTARQDAFLMQVAARSAK